MCIAAPSAVALEPLAKPDAGVVTDGHISALARSGDTLYIGGFFNQVGPATGPGVLLSAATGARSTSFPAVSVSPTVGFGPRVFAVLGDGAGGVWIGGDFTAVGGTPHPYLAHVLAGGSVDTATPAPNGAVRALALSPSGSTLYIGGDFDYVGVQARSHLAAIDLPSQTLDATWAPTVPNGTVNALAADANRVYVGGSFTAFGGATGNRLVALSPVDGSVLWSGDANGDVRALGLDVDRVYVGGAFTTVLGATGASRLAALNVTGTFAWDGSVTTAGSEVDTIALDGASLFAGGTFSSPGTIGGAVRDRIAKLTAATGVTDAGWNPGADGPVQALKLSGSTLYAGGSFTQIGGQPRTNLAALDASSAVVSGWTTGTPDNSVLALEIASGGIYAGGTFDSFGVVPRSHLAAIDLATGQPTGWAPVADTEVYALVATPSTIYIGGSFSNVNSESHDFIAAVNASDGQTVTGWNTSAGSYVNSMAIVNGRLFIGGYFTTIDGTPAQEVAALDPATGDLITSWTGQVTAGGSSVDTVASSEDGAALYIAGNFTEVDGVTRFWTAALSTSDGSLLPLDLNTDEPVFTFVPHAGLLYVGGDFALISGENRTYLVAVDPATGTPTSWDPAVHGDVHAIGIHDSTVYLGGTFDTVGGQPRSRLAAVDIGTGALSSFDPGPDSDVVAMLAGDDGTLVIGGSFTSLMAGPAGTVAVFSAPPSPTAAPTINAGATADPGQTLDCASGAWTGSTPQTFAWQWLQDGNSIAGATATSYTVTDGDAGHQISCRVTVTNRRTSTSATSSAVNIPAPVVVTTPGDQAPPPPPPLPPPELGRTINVYVVKDPVFYKLPKLGKRAKFQQLIKQAHLPNGTVLDTRKGRVRVEIDNGHGGVDSADFYEGVFEVNQRPKLRGLADIFLDGGGFKGCPKASKDPHLQVAAKKKPSARRSVRHLWGDGSGKFRTVGRFASATVRGTQWLTDDRCDGTLVRVKKGQVGVRDFVKRKTIVLSAPNRYFAAARKRR